MQSLQMLSPGTPFPTPFPNGAVVLIDKPIGWTSFDVVNKVRYGLAARLGIKFKKLKVGHAGTLDPLASGLLVLCVGDYTKKIELLQALPKGYSGVITFGATTPSFDLEKAVDKTYPTDHITDERLQALIPQFTGIIQQAPPVFSAIRIEGKRVYLDARTGVQVDMPERPVLIESLKIGPLHKSETSQLDPASVISKKGAPIYLHPDYPDGLQANFEVVCGKGTYMRSLANDMGMALDSGAYLSSLRRTMASGFHVDDSWQIADFSEWVKV